MQEKPRVRKFLQGNFGRVPREAVENEQRFITCLGATRATDHPIESVPDLRGGRSVAGVRAVSNAKRNAWDAPRPGPSIRSAGGEPGKVGRAAGGRALLSRLAAYGGP